MTDFFRINMPYGMLRNDAGEWMFFNREYTALGSKSRDRVPEDSDFYCAYTGITEKLLLELAVGSADRNENGEIVRICFYSDQTTPALMTIDDEKGNVYTEKLKKLCALRRRGC